MPAHGASLEAISNAWQTRDLNSAGVRDISSPGTPIFWVNRSKSSKPYDTMNGCMPVAIAAR